MGIRGQHEEDDAADAAEREAESSRDVAVLRSERAGGKGRDQLGERGGHQPRQRIGGDHRRLLREPSCEQLTPEVREDRRQDRRRDRNGQERECIGAELRAEPSFRLGASQVWNDDHPEGLGAEHEHEVDAVGGHETVGLLVSPELVRQKGTGDGGGQAQGHI